MATSSATARRIVVHPTGRRERHRAEVRERLFGAALRLFAERGYLETTVEDITDAADVGKGTFFNYFETKEHVLARFGAERIAAVERACERAKTEPVLPLLRELATEMAGQSKESPALLRAIYAAHASCAPVRAELHKRIRMGRRLLAEILAIAQERGEVRRDVPAAEMARLVQVLLFGTTLAWALNPDSSLRRTAQDTWDLFVPGILADTKRSRARNRRRARR